MNSTSGGLEEGRFFISEVLNLVEFLLLAGAITVIDCFDTASKVLLENVFRKSTVFSNTASPKVLAKQRLTTPAIEACVTLDNEQKPFISGCAHLDYFDKKLAVMPTSATQRSPMAKPLTFLPISTMLPTASWPGMSYCDLRIAT